MMHGRFPPGIDKHYHARPTYDRFEDEKESRQTWGRLAAPNMGKVEIGKSIYNVILVLWEEDKYLRQYRYLLSSGEQSRGLVCHKVYYHSKRGFNIFHEMLPIIY